MKPNFVAIVQHNTNTQGPLKQMDGIATKCKFANKHLVGWPRHFKSITDSITKLEWNGLQIIIINRKKFGGIGIIPFNFPAIMKLWCGNNLMQKWILILFLPMDYVRDGEIQGRSLVFLKVHCPCILPVNDRKYVFHFRPKPKLEKHLALGRIPKPKPKVQIYVKIGGILLKFIVFCFVLKLEYPHNQFPSYFFLCLISHPLKSG